MMDKQYQKLRFVKLVRDAKHILFGQICGSLTRQMKTREWKRITDCCHSMGVVQAQKDYQYMRGVYWWNIKRATLAKRDNAKGSPPNYTELDKMVLGIVEYQQSVPTSPPPTAGDFTVAKQEPLDNTDYSEYKEDVRSLDQIPMLTTPWNSNASPRSADNTSSKSEDMSAEAEYMSHEGECLIPEDEFMSPRRDQSSNCKLQAELDFEKTKYNLKKRKLELMEKNMELQTRNLELQNYKLTLEVLALERSLNLKDSKFTKHLKLN